MHTSGNVKESGRSLGFRYTRSLPVLPTAIDPAQLKTIVFQFDSSCGSVTAPFHRVLMERGDQGNAAIQLYAAASTSWHCNFE